MSDELSLFSTVDKHFVIMRAPDGGIFGVRLGTRLALPHGEGLSPLVRDVIRVYRNQDAPVDWPSRPELTDLGAYVVVRADERPVWPVSLRCLWIPGKRRIVLDVGNDPMSVVQVDADGIAASVGPHVFRRGKTTASFPWPLPESITLAEDLAPLWTLAPVHPADRPLVLALLVSAWMTGVPQPVVLLTGPQDAGKTATARFLLSLVDPVTHERGGGLPEDERQWKARVAGSRVVLVDNLSGLNARSSDMLCRVATGGEASSRRLYTDDELHVNDLHIPVWLTSIDPGALRGDLSSRMVVVELVALNADTRLAESELRARQHAARPRITRGLLDLTVAVLGLWPTIDKTGLGHRMGDFAILVRCVDKLLGTGGESRLADRGIEVAEDVLDGDPVAVAVLRIIDSDGWLASGKMRTEMLAGMPAAQWLAVLNAATTVDESARGPNWPRTPSLVSAHLLRIAPALRLARGVTLERSRTNRQRTIRLVLP